MTPLKTAFGKRHGWEIQHLRVGSRRYTIQRLTAKDFCREANCYELALWNLLKKLDPEQFKVSR